MTSSSSPSPPDRGGRTLTAWLFPTALAVDGAEVRAKRLEEQGQVGVHDWVSIIWLPDEATPRTRQHRSTGKAAGKGTLWGVVIGSVLGGPIAGAVVGATAATAGHKLTHSGIPDEFIGEVREELRPGSSALLLLSDRVAQDALATVGGDEDVKVLRADLDAAAHGELEDVTDDEDPAT